MKRSEFFNDIEQQLTAKRDALSASVAAELSELRHEDEDANWEDHGDSFDSASHDLNCQLAERTSDELLQINAALARLHAETYGECEDCGCEIPVARLKALPFATLCVDCQLQREHTGHQPEGYHPHQWPPSTSDYTTEDLDNYEEELSRNPMMEHRVLQVV